MKCRHEQNGKECGADLPFNAKYCCECGAEVIVRGGICPMCHQTVIETQKFCSGCKWKVHESIFLPAPKTDGSDVKKERCHGKDKHTIEKGILI